jgi:hypothetical protein
MSLGLKPLCHLTFARVTRRFRHGIFQRITSCAIPKSQKNLSRKKLAQMITQPPRAAPLRTRSLAFAMRQPEVRNLSYVTSAQRFEVCGSPFGSAHRVVGILPHGVPAVFDRKRAVLRGNILFRDVRHGSQFHPLKVQRSMRGQSCVRVHNRVRLDRPLILKLSLLSVLMAPLLLAEDARAVMVSFDARSSRLARRKVWTKSKSRQRNGAECAGCELPWISRNMTFVAHSRPPHPVNWRRAAAR